MADLTTLAAVKLYLGGNPPATDDGVLTSLISAYSQWVRSYCRRDFNITDYEIYRDGRCNRWLGLPQTPVVAITLLEVDGKAIPAQAAFGEYGYRFTDTDLMVDGLVFPWGQQNIHIQYQAGYSTIPADIAQAVNELVALRYRLRDKLEWTSKTLAGETVALSTKDMPASVATVLKQYARKVPL